MWQTCGSLRARPRSMTSRIIAIVEDETALRDNYREALERYGFVTRGYANRSEAESAFDGPLPDLVIIDIGLGNEPEGGFELCRRLRSRSPELPIIFLTARDSDLDAVSGLRLGADDYLTKDISNQHLLARILALFRRIDAVADTARSPRLIQHGRLEIDSEAISVAWNNSSIPLTVTEFWMVHALAAHPGHVRSRDQLMEAANLVVDGSTVTSHIKRIRRKFQALDPDFDVLETVHGAGYRWRR